MNRRDFLKAIGVGLTVVALPHIATAQQPYPPEIARFITPDFAYVRKIKRIRNGETPSDVYEFWHEGINRRLHIGYLPNGDLAAQWWYKGVHWRSQEGYYCSRRRSPRYMQRFIQSYIKEHKT